VALATVLKSEATRTAKEMMNYLVKVAMAVGYCVEKWR